MWHSAHDTVRPAHRGDEGRAAQKARGPSGSADAAVAERLRRTNRRTRMGAAYQPPARCTPATCAGTAVGANVDVDVNVDVNIDVNIDVDIDGSIDVGRRQAARSTRRSREKTDIPHRPATARAGKTREIRRSAEAAVAADGGTVFGVFGAFGARLAS